jgi:hypothetical protein
MKLLSIVLLVIILLPGCQKILDYYNHGEAGVAPDCKIVSFSYDWSGAPEQATYHYDAHDNPVLIKYPDFDIGHLEEFLYDHLDRLVAHSVWVYIGDSRVYVYEGNSRNPDHDTATDIWGRKWLETFTFDANGRIIRQVRKWVWSPEGIDEALEVDPLEFPIEVQAYYYDLRGNRQINPIGSSQPGPVQYTDKPSMHTLHPTWQLVNRDWSKNSVRGGKTFNQQGLPLTFEGTNERYDYECE